MKLVNAEIKSKKELATRLMEGEVFWTQSGAKIYFLEENFQPYDAIPFRFDEIALDGSWEEYPDLQKEVIWYKNIEKPVLCWCNDAEGCDNQKSGALLLVKGYTLKVSSDYPFDTNDNHWKYATPVTQEEASQWVVG